MKNIDNLKDDVWQKGITVEGYNPDLYRQDVCGAWIMYSEYGKTSVFGWEIDHIYPKSKGGDENAKNLRPMHHRNNVSKADDYPVYTAVVTAENNRNIEKTAKFTVSESKQSELRDLYHIES